MNYKTIAIAAISTFMAASAAFAMDLDQARSAGLVGEKMDGYVAAIQNTPDIGVLVADINAKRQQEYARISREKGQPIDVVSKLAAGQIITRLPAGASYQMPDGTWRKR